MDDKEQMPPVIHANDGVASFVVATGLENFEKGIEKGLSRLFKGNTLVAPRVESGFFLIPDKGDALVDKMLIPKCIIPNRIYIVNMIKLSGQGYRLNIGGAQRGSNRFSARACL